MILIRNASDADASELARIKSSCSSGPDGANHASKRPPPPAQSTSATPSTPPAPASRSHIPPGPGSWTTFRPEPV